MSLSPDTDNSGISPDVRVPGWELGLPTTDVVRQTYRTNYGDATLPTGHDSSYSRFRYVIPIRRPGYGYFLKLLMGLLMATSLGFMMFWLKPTEDARFNLGVGALFAVVASEYVVAACLPATHVLTLADVLHMLALGFILLAIGQSIVSLRLCQSDSTGARTRSRSFDRWSILLFGAGLCATLLLVQMHYRVGL